jgi:hypothetical protein
MPFLTLPGMPLIPAPVVAAELAFYIFAEC